MSEKEIKGILDKLYLEFEKAGLTAPEYSDLRDYITNLQEENTKVHKELDYAYNYNIYLISKIDKAIECINYYAVENDDYSKIYNDEEKELLNILKGDIKWVCGKN